MNFPTNVTELTAYVNFSLSQVKEDRTATEAMNAYRGPLPITEEQAILFVATTEAATILNTYTVADLVSRMMGGMSVIDEQYVEEWLKGLVEGYGDEEEAFVFLEDSITAHYHSGE